MADRRKKRPEVGKIEDTLGGYWSTPGAGRQTTNSKDSSAPPIARPAPLPRKRGRESPSPAPAASRGGGGGGRPRTSSGAAAEEDTPTSRASTPMSSQRNRNSRGPNRNGGQGEEVQLWQQSKDDMRQIVDMLNETTDNVRSIQGQDSYMAQNPDSMPSIEAEERKLEELFRRGVKNSDSLVELIKSAKERVQVLSAIQKAKEEAEGGDLGSKGGSSHHLGVSRSASGLLSGSGRNPSRAMREQQREQAREARESSSMRDPASLYDFDGAESPVPSPLGSHHTTRKLGNAGSDRSGNRDSVPPRGADRDTPKADSAEPPATGSSSAAGSVSAAPGASVGTPSASSTAAAAAAAASAAATQRSKVVFSKGQDVAFKPKQTVSSDSPDWYLGKVQQVLGEGKSRRYKVKDEDPDLPPDQRTEYRTSASNMIPIPGPSQELPNLDKGKTVLALYPDSTTFYKAEVMGTDAATGKVNLRFEGEETSGTLQLVERRFVVEYRS
ncbi:hypothetical protein RB597_009352 [Gaeumannomyces tritici]